METETLDMAIKEAKRFIEKANKVTRHTSQQDNGKTYTFLNMPSKESSACRRASMDLTRALAEMRRP